MPNRIIREGINSSRRFNALSLGAQDLYRRLLNVVDDYGRFYSVPFTLLGACWPICPNKISVEQIKNWLDECSVGDHPLLLIYEKDGCKYLEVNDFRQPRRAKKSRFPEPATQMIVNGNHSDLICDADATQLRAKNISLALCDMRYAKCDMRSANANNAREERAAEIERFEELWAKWPRKVDKDSAVRDWLSVVTPENEAEAMACAQRYLASQEVARLVVRNLGSTTQKTGWLVDCHRDGWKSDWPRSAIELPKIDSKAATLEAYNRMKDKKKC